ncbi:cytochrome P450- family 76- subfamily C-polypeptide 7 [Striga hermonthica]|uniref:Cytochrome P450- family 76- subfamily C-polypeptide 7 n=1 Tax=Striga hermonthica TaxID=68872 RepID=A0A9N7RB75_STRHE|nr:cytochrome P450- family 76- subfamily C-polypeptide 7 [Striga hermonthica]
MVMDNQSPLLTLVILITLILTFILNSWARKPSKLPPGPFPWPIIGNILSLGPKPHQSLARLAQKHGPVMSLKLGAMTTVVISSPETARVVLQQHDLTFSSRKIPATGRTLGQDEFSITWLPVGGLWRKLRKICREQMFSSPRLDASAGLRREKLGQLHDFVALCCDSGRAVDVGEVAFVTSLNLMSATLFSKEFAGFGSGSSHEVRELVTGAMRCLGRSNLVDFFPILKWIDPQGIQRDAEYYYGKLFEICDGIVEKRIRQFTGEKDDLLQALVDLHHKGDMSITDIRNILPELLVAGSDTTSSTVEWAMAELLRNPLKLTTLRNEINREIGARLVQESDIPRLPYLRAVVKETLRLHPILPFLVPREANTDVEVNGYIVPKGAQVLVNIWSTGRDPNVWPKADVFWPERFLGDSEVDFKGKYFELIPFGSGRRMCPGMPLANRMLHLMIATLAGSFGWRLEGGVQPGELDMDEKFGLSVEKAEPLKAVPVDVRS